MQCLSPLAQLYGQQLKKNIGNLTKLQHGCNVNNDNVSMAYPTPIVDRELPWNCSSCVAPFPLPVLLEVSPAFNL